ncbi:hypothetical protein BU24DRAFT_364085 [Aaosphaeria arxii CBS 175.79]|uniref:Zn(2)-C6 fungal-type domain-containing protein n=1 Tax=Aaosphaeria arxii CBS 175.79 TaxID=1450172 RepID=A0A6A5XZU3_9PLEO|nr:uncharacterized protein BU24DRAFT_364085 [Aaosphaeria arxii CBS 175.79]KAF2018808.1 hypothetical protein BU24DRAFT_364085 [Aaosphaeria arxii CBS 175.79]
MSSSWTNFSVRPHDDGPQIISEDVPACASCRRRKLRCSRETPMCSHCERLAISCVYEAKQKPGLKLGAVEALSRRVALLEQILLDEDGNIKPQYDDAKEVETQSQGPEVQYEGINTSGPTITSESITSPIYPQTPQDGPPQNRSADTAANPRKRKLDRPIQAVDLFDLRLIDIADYLPAQPLILRIVDYFCISFHHWIPYLHKARLRKAVIENTRNPEFDLVLHALVAATLRHLDHKDTFLDDDQVLYQTKISKFIVETFAIKEVSLGSLQALILIVFDYLNSGQQTKAWPLIGSLTRTVVYLQLTLEPSASQSRALMSPLRLIQSTTDWTELEERRRLFWVIFLLDRCCSVSTGWNTSLTSEDVHRRLPADGGYFTREEPVTTPYFGIWNKAAARIGRSLAHVPAQYNDDDPANDQVQGCSPGSVNSLIDSSKLGAFAYCIEATESLSQVTTFFLQQPINWRDKDHAINWLTRFKELDLRLVQWKLFLPPRWKDSDISPDVQTPNMDPNLTIAHITHNTSMIFLHHPIAYPTSGWNDIVALPKDCSAQTCEHAAIETANIVDKFLTYQPIFVNVHFAFCTFVAAKALLYQHQASSAPLRPEFEVLLRGLREMSARWRGRDVHNKENIDENVDQAGEFAMHLDYLYDRGHNNPPFRFDLYDHSCRKVDHPYSSPVAEWTPQRQPSITNSHLYNEIGNANGGATSVNNRRAPSINAIVYNAPHNTHSQTSTNFQQPQQQSSPNLTAPYIGSRPPTEFMPVNQAVYPSHFQNMPTTPSVPGNVSTPTMNQTTNGKGTGQDDSLLSLSDALMDSQFLDLDRVITFEDTNFYVPVDGFKWS